MLQISEVDYRVREMILIYLLRRHTETKDDPLWTELNNYLALEIAKCYWLGFGAKRDEKLAGEWLKKTSLRNDWDWHITGITTARNSGYLPCMKITSHILIGHIQLTNDMQCYRDQKLADTILTVERRELEDWTVALGQTHFLVNQRVFNLFEKLNSLGLRNQALNLIERHYDRIKTASPEFDNMSFQRITTALAKAHISIRDHVRARELLLSVYPSWKTSSMRNNAVNNMSDEEFLARSSDYVLLAAIEDEASNYQEAIRMYKTALPRMQQLLGAQNLQCLRTQYNLALCYNNEGKNQESLAVIDAAYELVVGTYGEAHEMSVLIGEKLNELRTNLRIYRAPLIGPWLSRNFEFRFKFDNDSVRASIESSQATLGNNHPYTLVCINRGIKALMGDTRYDEAIKLAECALQIVEDRSGADSDDAGFQRKRLKLCRQTAALHWAFFRWGSWDVGPYKLKRYRGFVVGWERKVFEPFELDLSKDPNYKSMNTVSSPTST